METPHSTSAIQPLATVLQQAPAIIYLYDIQQNTNVYANRSLSDFLGYSPEDVQKMGDQFLIETIHPNDLNRILAHHSEILPALREGLVPDTWLLPNGDYSQVIQAHIFSSGFTHFLGLKKLLT